MSDRNKFEHYIRPIVAGKTVLDVGAVQHSAEMAEDADWMHAQISNVADRVVGIDILEDEVSKLNEQGWDIRHGDAHDLRLEEKFEVVFLGEIIEHLTNFEGLFQSIDRHLEPDGRLIITTPNALSVYWSLHRLTRQDFVNPEHTCWFEKQTLEQLLNRFGFELIVAHHVRMSRAKSIRSFTQFIGWLLEVLLPRRIAHRNLVVVARRVEAES